MSICLKRRSRWSIKTTDKDIGKLLTHFVKFIVIQQIGTMTMYQSTSFKMFSKNLQGRKQERARTRQVHQTSYMRNPGHRLLGKVLSCVDTRGVILLLQRGLLRFRKRKYEKIEMLEKARRFDEPDVRDGEA
jgi:hypothetical protein